jgi:hypothetical protein
MNFTQIFSSYYMRYRGDSNVPTSTDPEYLIGMSFANDAIREWAATPDTLWNELFTSLATNGGDGDTSYVAGKTTYLAPSDLNIPGGYLKVYDPNSTSYFLVPLLQPEQAQIMAPSSSYYYFIGDGGNGYNMVFNPSSNLSTGVSWKFDYVYYKDPTLITDGNSIPQMSDPMFIVNYMLAMRFQNARNWTAFQSFYDGQATTNLQNMVNRNSMGTNYNKWKMQDPTGSGFGRNVPGGKTNGSTFGF